MPACAAAPSCAGSRLLWGEYHRRERRQRQAQGERTAMHPWLTRRHRAEVAHATAPVDAGVAVEALEPYAAAGYADAVALARHRGEVAHRKERGAAARQAQERQYAHVGIVAVHPLEALGTEVELVQRGGRAVEAVQVGEPALHALVQRILQHVPLEALLVLPLALLAELP